MSNELTHSLPHTLRDARPRLGTLRAVAQDRLARAVLAVWQALEAIGARRANRELLALAARWEDVNPKLARELRSYVRGGSSY